MSQLFCTIVIPTCNRPNDLRKCVQALLEQLDGSADFEISIWDDSKDAATRRVVEKDFPDVKWNLGPRRGPASNRNAGAKKAEGKWLLFIDDDCVPHPTLISAYRQKITAMGKEEQVALEGPVYRMGHPNSLLWEAPHTPNGGYLISCNFAIPRQTFWEVGGFDERFPMAYFEDTEFAARAKQMGVAVEFVKEAAVDHPLRSLPVAQKLAKRWEARVIASYYFGAKTWQILWYLNKHVIVDICGRFRGQKMSWDNMKALLRFGGEYLMFLQKLPFWCWRHRKARSAFWSHPSHASGLPPRFGL